MLGDVMKEIADECWGEHWKKPENIKKVRDGLLCFALGGSWDDLDIYDSAMLLDALDPVMWSDRPHELLFSMHHPTDIEVNRRVALLRLEVINKIIKRDNIDV